MSCLTIVQDGQAVTTSRMVAEKFGKEHRHVLESIREILTVENSAVNFFLESTYENERGRLYPTISSFLRIPFKIVFNYFIYYFKVNAMDK